jgi:hypothetical protein
MKTFLAGPDGIYGNADDRRVYIKFAQEFNGNWNPWAPPMNPNLTPAIFVQLWKHMVDIFRANLVDDNGSNAMTGQRIQWIWNPTGWDVDPVNNPMSSMYPGDDYVDWTGINTVNGAYLWGVAFNFPNNTLDDYGNWIPLAKVEAIAPTKPFYTEFGSVEVKSGTLLKDSWFEQFFQKVAQHQIYIKLVTYSDAPNGIGN